jgi:DNA-binding GntR family transcriptional regulator
MSLKDKIYDEILIRIIEGDFPQDEFLVESKLTELFNVSRSPVREALIELCKDNVLKNIPRAGYQIVTVSSKGVKDACDVRIILETRAAELACDYATDREIEELEAIHQETMELSRQDHPEFHLLMKAKTNFHLKIANMSRNAILEKMIQEIIHILWRATAQRLIEERSQAELTGHSKYHGRILEALRSRNKEEAKELIALDYHDLEKVLQNY